MWIERIILVAPDGRRREINLEKGLNVIVGDHSSGKTSLLRIIEYLLGRSSCRVPAGPIRTAVGWYGMVLNVDGTRHLVGRRAPSDPSTSSSESLYNELTQDFSIDNFQWVANCTAADLVTRLSDLVGIPKNQLLPRRGSQLVLGTANIKHASWLCLQHQNDLTSQNHLFYRMEEEWPRRDLKAALPFFLGIQTEEDLQDERRLKQLKAQVHRVQAEIRGIESSAEELDNRSKALVASAVRVGYEKSTEAVKPRVEITLLADWVPGADGSAFSGPDEVTQGRIRDLEEHAYGIRQRRNEIEEFLSPAAKVNENGLEAKRRVASIGLLETLAESACPFCGTDTDGNHAEHWDALRTRLTQEQKSTSSSVRRLRKAREQLTEELDITQASLAREYESAREEKQDGEDIAAKRTLQIRQGTIIGRARELLKLYDAADQASTLRSKQDRLEALLSAVEERLDSSEGVDAAASIVVRIGAAAEEWAPLVGLDDFAKRVRLDIGKLALVADTDEGPVSIEDLGGGMNWEAYHVVAHLAIHKELRSRGRPVPGFLFLDQPSQVGLPHHTASGERLARIFDLLQDFVTQVVPDFQIIVTEVLGVEGLAGVPTASHILKDDEKLVPATWVTGQ